MMDTVKLLLSKNMFWITDVGSFQKQTQNGSRGYFTLVQNPTKAELLAGLYKPRLTLTKRFNTTGRSEATLSIEFSVQKLLFKNNFDELQFSRNEFEEVNHRLYEILKTMGVKVFSQVLITAPVASVHYAKNIPLTDGSTPTYYINRIKESNIRLSLDVEEEKYRNDGHGFKWHCNSYELAFYDKIKDLKLARLSDKRAIENDNSIQLTLFDELKTMTMFEVLRMEARLNNRQKMMQLFKKLGIESDLTFKNLFNKNISQQILLHYLDELESKRPPLLDYKLTSSKDLLSSIIVGNPKLKLKQILQMHDLKYLLDTITLRELRSMFGKYNDRSWQRLMADAAKLSLPKSKSPFMLLRENLTTFEPLRLVDFQGKMLNNDKYDQNEKGRILHY